MSAVSLMPDVCTITPRTLVTSASGATSYVDGTPLTDVPCNIQRQSATDANRYGIELATNAYMCHLPLYHEGTALSVEHTARLSDGTSTYRVVGPALKENAQAVHQVVVLELDTP